MDILKEKIIDHVPEYAVDGETTEVRVSNNCLSHEEKKLNISKSSNDSWKKESVEIKNAVDDETTQLLSNTNFADVTSFTEGTDENNDEKVTKVDEEEHLSITNQSKLKIILKDNNKVKEVEMISGDAKDDDNINYNKTVATIADSTQIMMENEDRTVIEEDININNKKKIKTNVDGVSNKINQSLDPQIVDNGNRKVNDDTRKTYKVLEKSAIIESNSRDKEIVSKNINNRKSNRRELELINCRLEIIDKRTDLFDNDPDNNMTEQVREQQEYQSKTTNSKVISKEENNTLQRVNDKKKKVAMVQWIT